MADVHRLRPVPFKLINTQSLFNREETQLYWDLDVDHLAKRTEEELKMAFWILETWLKDQPFLLLDLKTAF